MNYKFFALLLVLGIILTVSTAVYSVEWYYDTEPAMWASSEQKKPMMWVFTAKRCGYCQKMESETFTDPRVSSLLEKFICVKIDFDEDRMFAERCCKVTGVPTFIFYGLRGNIIERVVGYRSPSDFAGLLERVLSSF